jgi:heme iron utilization protein
MDKALTSGQQARRLLRRYHYGVLSTLSQTMPGYPYGAFVDYVTDHQGRPVMLISALAEHTHNINHTPRVSLTVHAPGTQTEGRPRMNLMGEAKLLGPDDGHHIRDRYLRHFPEAEQYLSLDFAFYRIDPQRIRFIPGFAQATWVSPGDFLSMSANLADVETSLIEQINRNNGIAGVGIDCDGFTLRRDGQLHRIEFEAPGYDASAALAALAKATHS